MNPKKKPVDEEKCLEALSVLQKLYFEQVKKTNLQKAEELLAKNSQDPTIHQIINERLQYQVLKEGIGKQVESYHTPLVRYECKTIDGNTIELISDGRILFFDELSDGLQKSIVGMKRNEKRKIFVHPELETDHINYPNSLLIYEIEILEINKQGNTPINNPEIAISKKA